MLHGHVFVMLDTQSSDISAMENRESGRSFPDPDGLGKETALFICLYTSRWKHIKLTGYMVETFCLFVTKWLLRLLFGNRYWKIKYIMG